jgi:hypothetical protein
MGRARFDRIFTRLTMADERPGAPQARRWVPCKDVVARRVGDSLVVVSLQANQIYELNGTGARIWELCTAGTTTRQLLEELVAEFDVDADRARAEVEALESALADASLIEPK